MFAGRETLVAAHDSLRMNGPSWRDCGTRELEFSGSGSTVSGFNEGGSVLPVALIIYCLDVNLQRGSSHSQHHVCHIEASCCH